MTHKDIIKYKPYEIIIVGLFFIGMFWYANTQIKNRSVDSAFTSPSTLPERKMKQESSQMEYYINTKITPDGFNAPKEPPPQ